MLLFVVEDFAVAVCRVDHGFCNRKVCFYGGLVSFAFAFSFSFFANGFD